jgi:hypothetical protein
MSELPESHSTSPSTHYTIRPPLTIRDDGQPTASIVLDAQRVFDFIQDERHLTAQKLYHSVLDRLPPLEEANPVHTKSSSPFGRLLKKKKKNGVDALSKRHADIRQVHDLLSKNASVLDKLEVPTRLE